MADKKGKVFVETSKGVFPLSEFRKREGMGRTSKQIQEASDWFNENDLISPPYSPESFLLLYESNPAFWRCVNQLAIDVAGLGWSLRLRGGMKENQSELDRLNMFLENPNKEKQYLRTILKRVLVDWGSVGWFGIEVIRDNKGDIAEIYHIPAHTFRIHKSKEKFCQDRNNKKVWFKRFGLEKNFSAESGEEGKFNIRTRANELIYYKNFYPKSDFYGVPNIISAVGDVMGLIGIRDYNLAFFENFGMPSAIIVLEGEWEEGSDKKIAEFLEKEIKGSDNAHKTLVVEQPENCKFTYTPLETKEKEGSFRLYEQIRRDDVLMAYSMPPERVGVRVVGKLGGNVAEEATKIYVQGVVEPLQLDLEDIINKQLLQSEIYEFKFTDIDLRDYTAEVERSNKQIEHGVKTPNEVRNELGLKAYPEGDKFYIASNLIEVGTPEEKE